MLCFSHKVLFGTFERRYKRFFMDVQLEEEKRQVVVAHTPNTGSMEGLLDRGNRVLLTHHPEPGRKLLYTAQAIEVQGTWVGINTHLPNQLIKTALLEGYFLDLAGYQKVRAEVKYGPNLRSRIDLLLSDHGEEKPRLYIEIKNVTLRKNEAACFPDAVSVRAQKHLEDLCNVLEQGEKAALFFVIQRTDCSFFEPASDIDPVYGKMLKEAYEKGLDIRCLVAQINESGLCLLHTLPLQL